MTVPPLPDLQRRRNAARRTVLVLAAIAGAIYVAFLVSGGFGFVGTPSQ